MAITSSLRSSSKTTATKCRDQRIFCARAAIRRNAPGRTSSRHRRNSCWRRVDTTRDGVGSTVARFIPRVVRPRLRFEWQGASQVGCHSAKAEKIPAIRQSSTGTSVRLQPGGDRVYPKTQRVGAPNGKRLPEHLSGEYRANLLSRTVPVRTCKVSVVRGRYVEHAVEEDAWMAPTGGSARVHVEVRESVTHGGTLLEIAGGHLQACVRPRLAEWCPTLGQS